jgi:hypothetical protein
MNQKRIVIDGTVYNSVDEMPPDVRQQYEQAMRNFDKKQTGTPDLLENMNPFGDHNVMSSAKIIVNGQVYDSVDQLPPDVRATYQQAIGAMDANGNGIPDFVEGMIGISDQAKIQAPNRIETSVPLRSTPKPVPASIEPESTGNWMLILAGIIFIGACLAIAAAGVWYFYLR